MRKVLTDRAAENDLIDIWVYTCKEWSVEQAELYLGSIEQSINVFSKAPESGKSREALWKGYFSFRVARHIIFYTFNESEIRIRRVLHEVMDIESHL